MKVADIKQPCKHGTKALNYCFKCGEEYIKAMLESQRKPEEAMNLSEMPAEKLLDIVSTPYRGYFDIDKRLAEVREKKEARAELLRRLQPVKPRCPKCGSERKLNWHREYSRVECQACDNFSAEVCTVEDWAVLFGSVLSREGEGKHETAGGQAAENAR